MILLNFLEKYEDKEYIDIYEIVNNSNINIVEIEWINEINWLYTRKKWKDIIFLSKNLKENIKRFTLAHEFCHFLLWERWLSLNFWYSKTFIEKRADDFAMQLLLPKKTIIEAINEYWNIPTLVEIFWVSEEVIKKRIQELN